MGLFMNWRSQPKLFSNEDKLKDNNQSTFKYDYLAEWIKSQKEMNESLEKSYQQLSTVQQKQEKMNSERWNEVGEKLGKLTEAEEKEKQKIFEELKQIHDTTYEMMQQLQQMDQSQEKMNEQVGEVYKLNQEISDKVSKQEQHQSQLEERLENQEALMEKISRQLQHFRSILFERTHDLAEKVEDSYKQTSTYVYNLMSKSEKK
ncbi:hypothetical protein RZN22_11855 [Bacillaceae bacterium S4-13-58]